MASDYEPPAAEYAEFVDAINRDCAAQAARLRNATPDEAWLIANDPRESQSARMEALLILFRNRDARISELQLSLLDDPDPHLWQSICHTYRLDHPGIRAALLRKMSDPDCEAAGNAAITLARGHELAVIPQLEEWLRSDIREFRCVALGALQTFRSSPADTILADLWKSDWGDREDRIALAMTLSENGNLEARQLLAGIAETAQGEWATACATSIYLVDRPAGLELMAGILDHGDLEARQPMVSQISTLAGGLPHAYTYDGLAESRLWVEQQLSDITTPKSDLGE